MPSLNLEVERCILIAHNNDFQYALGTHPVHVPVLAGESQYEGACKGLGMHMLLCIRYSLADDRRAYEGIGCAGLNQVIFMLLAKLLEKMEEGTKKYS